MRLSRIVASGLFFLLYQPLATFAYPIAPLTLWDLASRSERIVVGRVVGIEHDSDGDIARLRVVENWKGPFSEVVRVRFYSGMICPAPARYIEGREVLAFLEHDLSNGAFDIWTTVGLSYGTLYPAAEERPAYWHLIQRMRSSEFSSSLELEKNWHVEATVHRATRWHGLYRLVPGADAVHAYYDVSAEARSRLFDSLTREDMERIARGFLNEPSSDVTFPMTLEVLRELPSPELDTEAVALVEGLLLRPTPPYWTAQAMVLVWERFGDSDAPGRLPRSATPDGDPLLDFGFWNRDDVKLTEAWRAARDELGIPKVAPLVLPDADVLGVGPFTPP